MWAELDSSGECTAVFVDTRPMHGSQGPPEVEEAWAEPVGADVSTSVTGTYIQGRPVPFDVALSFDQHGWATAGIEDPP